MVNSFEHDGYSVFERDPRAVRWAMAAADVAEQVTQDPALRETWLRHRGTWFVGVDALPNELDGSINGVPLAGPWPGYVTATEQWHRAQLSVVYEGYPQQDASESDANHRFRKTRRAAHVDGILLENGRRYLREPHRFVLGLPLGKSHASPLVVWPGSHHVIGAALRAEIGTRDPNLVDITNAYKDVRAEVFERIEPVEIVAEIGQSMLLHRYLLHGVAPWKAGDIAPSEGRMIAYFRPEFTNATDWVTRP